MGGEEEEEEGRGVGGALTVLVSGAAALHLGTTTMVIPLPNPYHVTQ